MSDEQQSEAPGIDDAERDESARDTEPEPEREEPGKTPEKARDTAGKESSRPAKAAQEQPHAPAPYAEFRVPDGLAPDESLVSEFKELAGKMKLSQDQAQSLVDLQAKAQQAQQDAFRKTRQAWLEELYTDTDFGGENIRSTTDEARLALQEYDPNGGLLKLMVETGFQDNPDVMRFLARIGRERRREGRVLTSRETGASKDIPLEERLWPDAR